MHVYENIINNIEDLNTLRAEFPDKTFSLKGADLSNQDLVECDFSNTDLSEVNFDNSNLTGCKFIHVDCFNTSFKNANLFEADFAFSSIVSTNELLSNVVYDSFCVTHYAASLTSNPSSYFFPSKTNGINLYPKTLCHLFSAA